jgi:hypothetical protein
MTLPNGIEILYVLEKFPKYGITACGNIYSFKRKKILKANYTSHTRSWVLNIGGVNIRISEDDFELYGDREQFVARMKKMLEQGQLGWRKSKALPGSGYIVIYNESGEMQRMDYYKTRMVFEKRLKEAVIDASNLKGYYIQIEPNYEKL